MRRLAISILTLMAGLTLFGPVVQAQTDDGGTPAVLEVRAHDVPFLVEDGQAFFRLRFFRIQSSLRRLRRR
mgnify:CR=1 FL=1